jgi:hypothetical protein
MAPELRVLLEAGAGDPHDLPDVEAIWSRTRRIVWRRRVAATLVAAAVLVGAAVSLRALPGLVDREQPRPADDLNPRSADTLRQGQLEPGRYVAEGFEYPFSFQTSTDSWSAFVFEPTWVGLIRRANYLHVQVWDGVFDAGSRTARPADLEPLPTDLIGWLRDHPRLDAADPVPIEIGGVSGWRLDVFVERPLPSAPPECGGLRCVILGRVAEEGELVDVEVDQIARFVILDAPGVQILIHYRAPVERFERFSTSAERLLATFEFDVT